jgi:sRNA-binding regulator protein Hfq
LTSLRGKWVKIILRGGVVLQGILTGVNTYELFIQPSKGPEIMVNKGAMRNGSFLMTGATRNHPPRPWADALASFATAGVAVFLETHS